MTLTMIWEGVLLAMTGACGRRVWKNKANVPG